MGQRGAGAGERRGSPSRSGRAAAHVFSPSSCPQVNFAQRPSRQPIADLTGGYLRAALAAPRPSPSASTTGETVSTRAPLSTEHAPCSSLISSRSMSNFHGGGFKPSGSLSISASWVPMRRVDHQAHLVFDLLAHAGQPDRRMLGGLLGAVGAGHDCHHRRIGAKTSTMNGTMAVTNKTVVLKRVAR